MKTVLIAFLTIFSMSIVQAQKSWEAPLKSQLANAQKATSLDDLNVALGTLERIALTEKGEWLPNYYAAYYNVYKFWWSMQTEAKCSDCLDKADGYLTTAETADNNSEVIAMRAYYYQGLLNVEPEKAAMYGPKATGLLQKAIAMDATNPRAQLLLGQNLYYTPAQYGGGLERAKPYLAKAEELLKVQKTDGLHPSWGKADLDRVMAAINK